MPVPSAIPEFSEGFRPQDALRTWEKSSSEGKRAVYSLENRKMSGISGLTSTLSIARRQFPEAEIVIDGSPKVEYRHIVNAINACVSVGYVNVSFARPRAS